LAVWHVAGPDPKNAAYKTRQRQKVKWTYPGRLSLRFVVEVIRKGKTVPLSRPGSGGSRTKGATPPHQTIAEFPYTASNAKRLIINNNAMMASITADLKQKYTS
jgi:hypothetical protein